MSENDPRRATDPESHARRLAEARRRFFLLLKVMLLASLVVLAGAFYWLHASGTPMPVHLIVAVSIGVIGSLMLAAALMGLVFFSSASGADDDADQQDWR